MKHILQDLRDHLKAEANVGYYVSVGLILIGVIWLNYFSLPNQTFEYWLIKPLYGTQWGTLAYLALYGIPYFLAVLAYIVFHKEKVLLRSKGFWIRAGVGLLILSFDGGLLLSSPAAQYGQGCGCIFGCQSVSDQSQQCLCHGASFAPLLVGL